MTPNNWIKLKELFQATFELSPEERAKFLDEACDGDDDLRARVEKLIASHDDAGEFLASSALVDAGIITEKNTDPPPPETERLGQDIGPYKILREIGHGGMGTVFLAARADDQYQKQVAIKVVNRGMDTDMILRRFMMERQILADLEHPNIARLLEGGTTSDGLPYFVMEYVDGQPIDEYCDTHRFSTSKRLELFREVCAALQYAHQNLVIHRDIKPGNILVTSDGVPKLLDFGIAKLLTPEWAGDATITMQRLMTPAYASPEQLRGVSITTSTDVYSLGVVLYELLCGRRPHSLPGKQPDEIAEIVLSEEPLKPSVAATRPAETRPTTGTFATTPESIGRIREGTLDRLRRRLSGDLDNIVLKALRKEPERRYASVQEFSEDLRRHLVGLPVNASPDTFAYRAQKFVQRNRAAAIAAAVVITTLLGATGLTAWQARVAGRERDRADQRFIQVRKLANSVLFDYHAEIEKLPGSTPVRERMVKDALEYLDSLSAESANDPTLQRELAAAYQKVGDVQGGPTTANLGNRTGAITSYRAALAILESVRGDQPHNNSLRLEIADVNSKLFQTLWRMGQQEEAATHLSKALSEREELFAAEPKNLPYMLALARGYRDYGSMLASKMKKDGNGAISYYQKSNQLCDAIVTLDPANLEARAIAGLGYRMLGGEFEGANDISQAMDCYQKALALTQAREKLDPKNAQIQIVLADCYSNIGRALMLAKDEPGALEKFNLAMSLMQKDFEKDPTNALLKMNISQTYNNIGNAMAQSGRFTEAIANYDQALNLREAYVKDHPSETGFQFRLGETRFDLGDMYVQMASDNRISAGKKRSLWREAKSWYLRSLDVWQTLIKEGTLPGHLATKPDETIKAIGKCDAALAGH